MIPEFRKRGIGQPLSITRWLLQTLPSQSEMRSENVADFTGVLEPIAITFAVAVVAHDLGQAQRAEHGAHPLHASADRAGDLAWVQFVVLGQQLNDCERNRIAEQAAQTRLSVAILFHAASLSRFRNSGNVEMCTRYLPTR